MLAVVGQLAYVAFVVVDGCVVAGAVVAACSFAAFVVVVVVVVVADVVADVVAADLALPIHETFVPVLQQLELNAVLQEALESSS